VRGDPVEQGAKLRTFLEKLVEDPRLEAEFRAHPNWVMDEEGLNREQQELIRRAPLEAVRTALQAEGEAKDNPGPPVYIIVR
jgi:hypothetical protein